MINPLLPPGDGRGAPPVLASTFLGDYFRSRFTAGDDHAILEFAAWDKTALRRRWVVAALEAWQRQGTPEALERAQNFFRSFLQPARQEEAASLLKIIAADQTAFQDMAHLHHELGFPLREAEKLAAQRLGWPEAMAAEVYRQYLTAVAGFFKPDGQGNYPWNEVVAWLEECLKNLKTL